MDQPDVNMCEPPGMMSITQQDPPLSEVVATTIRDAPVQVTVQAQLEEISTQAMDIMVEHQTQDVANSEPVPVLPE